MKKIVFGFLLIFLNFNLNFNRVSINVLPDFVGYYLLLQGMAQMKEENPRFAAPRPFTMGMVVYTAILWVGSVLGVSGGVLASVLNLVALVVQFYIAWVLVAALRELETGYGADLYGAMLLKRWKILLGLNVVLQLIRLLAQVTPVDAVGMAAAVLVLADIIWAFLFILGWNRAANLWAEAKVAPVSTQEEPEEPAETERESPESKD